MFRLRCVNTWLRRFVHAGTLSREQVLEQLRVCSAEDQVFDVVAKNKAKLTVDHVSYAVGKLWQFQKEKPELLRTTEITNTHPEFTTLRVLAENKIPLMDDSVLVDTLYCFLRLKVEHHDSLIQQLVLEAWQRLDSLPMASLSKFAICLSSQHLRCSPLMGSITRIVDQRLSSINDIRILTTLMISISCLVSLRLRDALLVRADHLLDTMGGPDYSNPRRVVLFMRNVKYIPQPLLEKCNQILLCTVPKLDAMDLSLIVGLYQGLQFNNYDFRLAVKQRLIELIDSSTDPFSFTKLFIALAPMASPEIREGLEKTAFLLADEFKAHHALLIVEALQASESRNLSLLNKIASVIQSNLDVYKPGEVARIIQAFYLLRYQNPELLTKLRTVLVNFLQRNVIPGQVTMLVRVLSLLPNPRIDKAVISRVEAVAPQCNLNDLKTMGAAISKWAWKDLFYGHSTPGEYAHLLQTLNHCGHDRLQTADRLDSVLDDLNNASGEWLEVILLEEAMATLQRMMDQINWTNVPDLAFFLTRMNYLCPPLMDRIASVVIKDIDKIHYSAIHPILLPFSTMNYNPAQADQLYDVCIQRITPHISSFDPHLLVFQAYYLALANYFPEKLVREIFTIDFLEKLDYQLKALPDDLNLQTRLFLMELNRAVCLECPEFQVPWFHDSYCQQQKKKRRSLIRPVQQQIHKILGEVLGGSNYVRAGVVTPYSYTIDFECILSKHLQPLPYSSPSTLEISDRGKVHWGTSLLENVKDELPPGAQRVAVEFLDAKCFCKNSHHMKGETVMRKRHLEILGYRVVQIPHFEWNSMELSSQDAWKNYLKKKIFTDLSS